ncbi:MAG TPA: hypothetical protein DEP99_05385 [Nitrospiraceae bacterium]|nr:hypothetical protein [Nitrospiraceae bacterium]
MAIAQRDKIASASPRNDYFLNRNLGLRNIIKELSGRHPLIKITRIGARMALQVAIEEELCMLLRDCIFVLGEISK